jgi:AmiR/NasT family two-component response regulator
MPSTLRLTGHWWAPEVERARLASDNPGMELQPGSGSVHTRAAAAGERAAQLAGAATANVAQAVESIRQLKAELAQARSTIDNLEFALQTNRRIGMAIGIVMGQLAVTEEEAFTRLRIASQATNRKLRDVAEDVIYTGLPPTAA